MLKVMGVCLILAGAGGFGGCLRRCLNMHFGQMVECREIFTQLDAGREYLRLPYAQLLRRTARGKKEIFAEMLFEVADEMERNRYADADALWQMAFEKRKKQILFDEEEKTLFFALAKSLMLEGNHTQVAKMYFIQLEDKILKAMEEKKEKQKLYGTVSMVFGLFLIILLL